MAKVEQKLRKLLNAIAEEQGYERYVVEVKELSIVGDSYTAELFSATISAPQRDDLHLFAKVANLTEELRANWPKPRVFDIERFFYTQLKKTYEELEERHNVPREHRLVVPKIYGYNPDYLDETIVLENLTAKGFTCYDRLKSVTWEYASKSVEQLAKLHALSFAYQEEHPVEFQEALEMIPFKIKGDTVKDKVFDPMIHSAYEITKEEYKGKFKRFLDTVDYFDEYLNYYKSRNQKVIAHGDYKTSNLMHRLYDGKFEVIPIDFQTLHAGCPAADLMYYIFLGSDDQFRKLHYRQLIEHYYTQLAMALQRLDLTAEKVYPKADFEDDLKAVQMLGLIVSATILPILTVESDNLQKVKEDTDISDFTVKPSQLFAERFNGIVHDYVEWGLLQ